MTRTYCDKCGCEITNIAIRINRIETDRDTFSRGDLCISCYAEFVEMLKKFEFKQLF